MPLSFPYQIRRSKRAKKARIVVSMAKVEVVVPMRMSESVINQFVMAKQDWIIKALESVRFRQQSIVSFAPDRYENGVIIPFQGEKFQLTVFPTTLKRIKVKFNAGFFIYSPPLAGAEASEAIRKALVRWMQQRAKSVAEVLVKKYVDRFRLSPGTIRIKAQKSRWGSCGINNDINLNWVLILALVKVFEYVVVHELCHIRFRNHSTDFWTLVADLFPDYQQQRAWLKEYGASLMLGL